MGAWRLTPRLPYVTLKKYSLKKSKARDRMNVPVGVAVAAVLTGTQIWVFILFFIFLVPRRRPPVVDPHSTEDWDAVRPLGVGRRFIRWRDKRWRMRICNAHAP
jgi:hypothetical protein